MPIGDVICTSVGNFLDQSLGDQPHSPEIADEEKYRRSAALKSLDQIGLLFGEAILLPDALGEPRVGQNETRHRTPITRLCLIVKAFGGIVLLDESRRIYAGGPGYNNVFGTVCHLLKGATMCIGKPDKITGFNQSKFHFGTLQKEF
jgi:hypothetical protein